MEHILEVKNLSKRYTDFQLKDISFSLPKGSIMGLIGENGAGKSTIIDAILGLIKKDGGTVSVLGKQDICKETSDQLGVVFDGCSFPENLSPGKLNQVLKKIYTSWDENLYDSLLSKMELPKDKKIKTLSKGMKMKLALSAALAHHPRLLILDEATSGLDPVVREEILDLFLEFIQKEVHSILVSSHITSDLEKVADYITFIHQGSVVFSKTKDELIYQYGIIRCKAVEFESIDKKDRIAWRRQEYEWQVLVADKEAAHRKYRNCIIDHATIDEIMLLHVKGEK